MGAGGRFWIVLKTEDELIDLGDYFRTIWTRCGAV